MRCSRCVLPDTFPNITFDEDGVCEHCRKHERFPYRGESELRELLDAQHRSDSRYQCLVPVSGGRDSCFTLLKLVKDYKMKVLAVNYENPFTHPQAKANLEAAAQALDVPLVRIKLRNQIHERTFRSNMLAWFRKPSPALVPMMCIACKTTYLDILRVAYRYDVRCIVSGENPNEDTLFKKRLLNVSPDERYSELTYIKYICSLLREILGNPRYLHPRCLPTMVKGYLGYLFGGSFAIGAKLFGLSARRIPLFYYIEWDENEVLSRITSELNWQSPADSTSSWRFDCKIEHFKDLMYLKTLGMTERDDLYAQMVMEGLLTREEALRRVRKENGINRAEIEQILTQVGIRDSSFLGELPRVPEE